MAFPTQPIFDNTTRADENPLSDNGFWGSVTNAKLVSNKIAAVAAGTFFAITARQTLSANCEIYTTLDTVPAVGGVVNLYVRYDGAGGNYYFLQFSSYDGTKFVTVSLNKGIASVESALTSIANVTVSNGDQLGFSILGTTLTGYLNGASIISTTDSSVTPAGDLVILGTDTTTRFTQVGGGPFFGRGLMLTGVGN